MNSERSRSRGAALGLFVTIFTIGALTISDDQVNDDVYGAALASWRIAETGTPWLEGVDTAAIGVARVHAGGANIAPNGHLVVPRSPGVVAAAVPGYWAADAGEGPEDFSLVPGAISASLFVAISSVLIFLTLLSRLRQGAALLGAGAFALCTPMWSVAANGMWTHTVTSLGISGMAWAASRERWWLVGAFGGVGLWGRLHVSLIVAIVGVGVALSRRRVRIAAQVAVASVAAMALAGVWSQWMYGKFDPAGGYSASGYMSSVATGGLGSVRGVVVNELGLWVSPDRGILIWTPVLLVLMPAVCRAWGSLPDWSRWLLVGGLVYTLAQGYFSAFHGGDGFYGYRHGLEFLTAATPAFALSSTHVGPVAARLLGPILGAQFAVILVGAVSEGFYVLREDAWMSSSLWLALDHSLLVGFWIALMVVFGALASEVWTARSSMRAQARTSG